MTMLLVICHRVWSSINEFDSSGPAEVREWLPNLLYVEQVVANQLTYWAKCLPVDWYIPNLQISTYNVDVKFKFLITN